MVSINPSLSLGGLFVIDKASLRPNARAFIFSWIQKSGLAGAGTFGRWLGNSIPAVKTVDSQFDHIGLPCVTSASPKSHGKIALNKATAKIWI
jgi:hypothetical protein